MSGCTNDDVLVVRPRPVRVLSVKVDRRVRLNDPPISEVCLVHILGPTPSWLSL